MLIPLPGSNTPAEVWPVSAYTLRRRLARSPWLEIGLALAVSALLLAFIGADPTRGITGSESPFTDEAWNVMNARNFVLVGTWSTDQFNLHLVYGPFSLLEAGIFSVLGVGVVQARLLSILAIGLTTLALSVGLRRPLGRRPALLAAAAFGTCFLVLYYGRLAYTETLVMLAMTAGALLLVRAG
ncbi:MAG TPA: glycosyltransferase family 39 protein, partial [Verrucomicrobiae bacterium]|nr:glycosyltransferase family 39 protein [Verrucomicrobiae bacterium]